jgi:hypothetical protein
VEEIGDMHLGKSKEEACPKHKTIRLRRERKSSNCCLLMLLLRILLELT